MVLSFSRRPRFSAASWKEVQTVSPIVHRLSKDVAPFDMCEEKKEVAFAFYTVDLNISAYEAYSFSLYSKEFVEHTNRNDQDTLHTNIYEHSYLIDYGQNIPLARFLRYELNATHSPTCLAF